LGKSSENFLLEGEQLLDTRASLHPLKMRQAVFELRKVEIELCTAPETPKEVSIDRGEVVEEPFATG
jgi:hypothetical protein